MKQLWQKLENHLREHNPELLADLNPPATDAQVRELEKQLEVTLPEDFVACLRAHDGQAGLAMPLFDGYRFLSISEIVTESQLWRNLLKTGMFINFTPRPQREIADAWWSGSWVPFAVNDEGDCVCLDLAPTASGANGQIIQVWHDDGDRSVLADSLGEFVENILR
jgi:cell wall assembly regulator SMI1